jgi:hypothetical protein
VPKIEIRRRKMKTLSIFISIVLIFSAGCDVDHVQKNDGPIFVDAPDELGDDFIEICDDVGGLCWSYPINIDWSPSYESFLWLVTEEDLENPCDDLPGTRLATPDEFREASERCVFDYYAIKPDWQLECEEDCAERREHGEDIPVCCPIETKDLIRCSSLDCELNSYEADIADDSWNGVLYCIHGDNVPSSHQYVRCVKPID